jgi:hypothetical protein
MAQLVQHIHHFMRLQADIRSILVSSTRNIPGFKPAPFRVVKEPSLIIGRRSPEIAPRERVEIR